MNKKLLIIDILTFVLGIILLSVVQLMMAFNPELLTNRIVLISFAVGLIVVGAFIMLFSYKDNTDKISVGNFVLHLVFGVVIYILYSIPGFAFYWYYGVGNSVCIAFLGIYLSRYAFSFSRFLEANKKVSLVESKPYVKLKPMYSKNMPNELHETMKIFGFIVLLVCTIALIYNTINPCFNIAYQWGQLNF